MITRMTCNRFVAFISLFSVLTCAMDLDAQINMPDPSMIAGKAIPAPELPAGTVTVRVVRESIGNNITGRDVRVRAGSVERTAKTDEAGRAQFTDLPRGSSAVAEAVVGGERLTSDPFDVPSSGGVRVILIAGLAQAAERRKKEEAAAADAPAVKGVVVLGGDTRVVVEFHDDTMQFFYLLDIVNNARTRVDIGGPLVIELPGGAGGATVLQGSSPSAVAQGDHVTVTGPFKAGTTSVQIGFRLGTARSDLTIEQKFPALLERTVVVAQKVGDLRLTSPQLGEQREARSDNGTPFIMATGAAIPAGGTLTLEFSGIPAHATWPRNVALGLAASIVAIGVWLAVRRPARDDQVRSQVAARRESLYKQLVSLETQRRSGRIAEEDYEARRRRIVTELERVYGELDVAPPGRGGDEAAA
jgi:hypothetical protein